MVANLFGVRVDRYSCDSAIPIEYFPEQCPGRYVLSDHSAFGETIGGLLPEHLNLGVIPGISKIRAESAMGHEGEIPSIERNDRPGVAYRLCAHGCIISSRGCHPTSGDFRLRRKYIARGI